VHEWTHTTLVDDDPQDRVRLRHTFVNENWLYHSWENIYCSDFIIEDGADITFQAEGIIYLSTGFEVEEGAAFYAYTF